MSGIISDIVLGVPLGINALSLLIVAAVAAYIRVVTVRITLVNDWISFVPALLFANFIYFSSLYFSDYSVDYLYLVKNFTLMIELPFNEIKKSNTSGNISKNLNLTCLRV